MLPQVTHKAMVTSPETETFANPGIFKGSWTTEPGICFHPYENEHRVWVRYWILNPCLSHSYSRAWPANRPLCLPSSPDFFPHEHARDRNCPSEFKILRRCPDASPGPAEIEVQTIARRARFPSQNCADDQARAKSRGRHRGTQ